MSPAGILTFRFDNILLPDSTTNLEGSNGFVRFKVEQAPNLPYGTEITNSAGIYFDFNAPIITNTTLHTIRPPFVATVDVKDIDKQSWQVIAFPNPFTDQVTLDLKGIDLAESTFSLYSLQGQLMLQEEFVGQQFILKNTSALTAGVYFFTIQSEGEVIAKGKVVRR